MSVLDRAAVGLSAAVAFLPKLAAAIILLIIGYIVGKVVGAGVRRTFRAMKLDDRLIRSDIGSMVERLTSSPARALGRLAFWVVMVVAVVLAIGVLDVPVLNSAINAIFGYVPDLLAAILIIGVAAAVSAAVVAASNRLMGGTATAKIAATAIPAVTMTIAVFMALNQLKIARDIVDITFAALIGSVALGMSLAFGLGGRKVASEMLEEAYAAGREQVRQARQDLETARQQVTTVAPDMLDQTQEELSEDTADGSDRLAEQPQAWQPAFGETLSPGKEAKPKPPKSRSKKASDNQKS